ncbi:NlpC/P60 family protein [Breznakiella homolactica]|uniref:C40 family peptidase n=1 Tax=Breznakiella homolactica TaxID=2798577 RepID=A0A7T8BBX5_9SPIR|nr:NlpC/P60 family protein [Breznakiella homolactica]QQO10535.1 C40 family peptidase [Breznakiella homolactica]
MKKTCSRYPLFPAMLSMLFAWGCGSGISAANPELAACSGAVAERALQYAHQYVSAETEYEYGGQDPLRAIKIDCSGLVVNCYAYAAADAGYRLPFGDAAVIDFFTRWSVPADKPRPGDLIFMGDDPSRPSHIALFVTEESGEIFFIDATYQPENSINGVSLRSYPAGDSRVLSFGIILLLGD